MPDEACVAFLQWVLPRIGLRWPGYRRVRRTVCKRLRRRARSLGLADLAAYRDHLDRHPGEQAVIDALCRIPISRFRRDRGVWQALEAELLPALCAAAAGRGAGTLRAWSAGCASGEEPYSLSLSWRLGRVRRPPRLRLSVQATDADPTMLARARRGCYRPGSLRELSPAWQAAAFTPAGPELCLRPRFRAGVSFRLQDLRRAAPRGPFDLVLCRNLAFTYFAPAQQLDVLARIAARLRPDGLLVLGAHETLPAPAPGLEHVRRGLPVWRKVVRRTA